MERSDHGLICGITLAFTLKDCCKHLVCRSRFDIGTSWI